MPDTPEAQQLVSPERLAEIQARANAATAGPWSYTGLPYEGNCPEDPCIISQATNEYIAQTAYDGLSTSTKHEVEADTLFIAHARQDIPDLLADRAAFRQQVAAELTDLLQYKQFNNNVDDYANGHNDCTEESNDRIRAAAKALKISLSTPAPSA